MHQSHSNSYDIILDVKLKLSSFSQCARYAAYFLFSNPYTHFPRKNKARKMTELILQVNGYAQKIIVLSEDGIEESGTHEELMDRKGTYEKLYNMQFHK
jgi:hypothetical protein